MNASALRAGLFVLALIHLDAHADDSWSGHARPGFHAVQRLGITVGGSVFARLTRSDGSIREISTGGLYQVGAGLLYQAERVPFSTAFTLNYHYNSDSKDKDNATFRRFPLEALVYFNGLGDLRVGGGLRYNVAARADSTLNGVNETLTFRNGIGHVVELGYQVRPGGWISLRHVSETYTVAGHATNSTAPVTFNNARYDGSHTGFFLGYEY